MATIYLFEIIINEAKQAIVNNPNTHLNDLIF